MEEKFLIIVGVICAAMFIYILLPFGMRKKKKKGSKRKHIHEAPEKDWEQIALRLERQVQTVKMDIINLEKKDTLLNKHLVTENVKNKKLQEKLLQERGWQEKEKQDNEKMIKENRNIKKELTK